MTMGVFLALLLLTLPGCAQISAIWSPSKPAAPATAAPVPPTPQATPPAPESPPEPAPVVDRAPPPTPRPPASAAPSGPLTPQLPMEQERRLRQDAERKLDETDRLLQQLEGRPLPPKDRETLVLAQSFLAQARKALEAQEYERAANLAAKARTLTDDLASTAK